MTLVPLMIAALLSAPPVAGAHPGHGSKVLTGTLKAVAKDAITLEIRDLATLQIRSVRIPVDDETKYRVGKEPIEAPGSMIGSDTAAVVDYEDGPGGEVIYRAIEVRITKPKNKKKN